LPASTDEPTPTTGCPRLGRRTGDERALLSGHGAIVSEARFSADGRWLVTAGPGTAGLWSVESGLEPSLLTGHSGLLRGAAFAGDGYTILTAGGEDGTIRTYTCEVCGRIPDLLALADRRLAGAGDARR
jgi:WD40 repeat protein